MAHKFTRREFLNTMLAGITLGAACNSINQKMAPSGIYTRPLGNTGERLSIIGMGGWDIGNLESGKESIAIMHEAIANGVNFFDNCIEYHNGYAEEIMGQALKEGKREKVFLMTKVCGRLYDDAKKHLDNSLRRLQTDRIDLWMFHGIKRDNDSELIMDYTDGAIRAAVEAKKAGKIRYIGFTGHYEPYMHLEMLNAGFDWDAVLMPLNILDAHYRSFQHNVLPVCNQRNIGTLGMKSLAAQRGRLVRDLNVDAKLARRYTLSLPINSLVCGIQSREDLRQDLEIARNFEPLTREEVNELLAIAEPEAQDGEIERYKTGDFGCNWHHRRYTG